MKLKLLFVAVLISASVFGQNVPSYVPTNGLVGWWPFNGNANDESGNGNNGTVNGATLTTDRFGVSNNAYSFDGIDDFIDFGNVASLAVTNSSIISISFWGVNLNNGNPLSRYDNLNAPNSNFAVIWNTNGVGLQLTGNGTNGIQSSNFSLNTWTHVVAEFDGINSTASLYINGTLQVNGIVNYASSISTSPFFAGKVDGSFPGFFNGNIDDIAVYNRALTQQEITALYQSQQTQCLPAYVPTSGLVGWWPFCGNAVDESGNGNNGIVNGATLTTDRLGVSNSAFDFSRTTQNSIDVPNSNLLDSLQELTISFWVNLRSYGIPGASGHNQFINKSDQGLQYQFLVGSNFTGWYLYYSNTGFFQTNNLPTLSTWTNLTVSYKYDNTPLNSWCKFYMNGSVVDSFQTTTSLIPSMFNLWIGRLGSLNYNQTDGNIDDIGIWNRALTQQEITYLYNSSATSISEITPSSSTTVYPNPTSDVLNVKSDAKNLGSSYRIIDVTGRTISTGNITSESMTLDVGNYVSGMYLLVIGEGRDSIKIFKN